MKRITASVLYDTPVIASDSGKLSECVCLSCKTTSIQSLDTAAFCFACGEDDLMETVECSSFDQSSMRTLVDCASCGATVRASEQFLDALTTASVSVHCSVCGERESLCAKGKGVSPKSGNVSYDEDDFDSFGSDEEDFDSDADVDADADAENENDDVTLDLPELPDKEKDAVDQIKDTIEDNTELDASITVAFSGNNYAIFKSDKVIATINKADVSDSVKTLFGTKSFLPALKAAITANRLNGYGIKKVSLEIDDSHISDKIESAKKEALASIEKEREDLKANFEQAVSIAAAGQLKGFYGQPLYSSFEKELIALGIANAKSIVSRLVSNHGAEQLDILVDEAMALMSKTTEERNELAEKLGAFDNTTTAGDVITSALDAPTVSVTTTKKFGTLFPK